MIVFGGAILIKFCLLIGQTDHGDWEFDPLAKNWVKTVFPSRLPAGRHEVSVSL